MYALLISLALICSTSLIMCDPVIGIAMIESTQAFPFLVSSRNSSGQRQFGASLRSIVGGVGFSVPFQSQRRVANLKELFADSSNSYPTSIQHKIPHLARALGNTRYVTIAEDPTLVYPWKASAPSAQWTSHLPEDSENTNSINHGLHDGYPDGGKEIIRHGQQEQAQLEAPPRPYEQKSPYAQKPSHEQRLSYGQKLQHDPGRNSGDRQVHGPNLSREYRPPAQARPSQGQRPPTQKETHHFHYHSRRREHRQVPMQQRTTPTPSASSEEQPPTRSSRDPDNWSLNVRYGDQKGQGSERGCSPQRSSQGAQQQPQRSTQPHERSNEQTQEQQMGSSSRRPTYSPRTVRPARNYEDELRSRYNDLPVLRARWNNQPYRQQESRTIPDVQMANVKPEWELTEHSFHAPYYNDPRGRKLTKNLTTIIEEEFDKRPQMSDYQKPYQQAEYRYTGYPSFEHGDWFSPGQSRPHSAAARTTNSDNFYRDFIPERDDRRPQYVHHRNQETREDDIEEILSEDDDADVGIVAIGDRANRTDHREQVKINNKDKKNSSQDFLAGGELRFPDQNAAGLRELTELLKDVPVNRTTEPYNHNGTRGHLVRTTKNIEVTREMFIDGKYREHDLKQQPPSSQQNVEPEPQQQQINSWDPLTQRLPTIPSPTKAPNTVQLRQPHRTQTSVHQQRDHGHVLSNRPVPDLSVPTREIQYDRQRQQQEKPPSPISLQPQYRFRHSGVSPIRQVDAPKFERVDAERHRPTRHGVVLPRYSSEEGGPLRKRVRKIQTHTTIEVVPVAPLPNDTELTTTGYAPYSSEEGDYPSREREPFYSEYYQDNQVQDENTTLPVADYREVENPHSQVLSTENAETSRITSQTPVTPAPTGRPTVSPKQLRRQPTIRNKASTKVPYPSRMRTPVTSAPIKSFAISRLQRPLKTGATKALSSAKLCDYKDCSNTNDSLQQPISVAKQNLYSRRFPADREGVTATARVTPRQSRKFTPYTATRPTTPSPSANTSSITTIKRRRKKLTPAPTITKETAPVATKVQKEDNIRPLRGSGSSANVGQLAGPPARYTAAVRNPKVEPTGRATGAQQFRKRKAADEELEDDLQDKHVAEASDDNPDNAMRVQFHLQGFSGPDSYRYGFHTADPYNPLERFEERDGEGRVRGHYSYIDPKGERVTVNYAADQNGFQIVKGDGAGGSGSAGGGGGSGGGGNTGTGDSSRSNTNSNNGNNIDDGESDTGGEPRDVAVSGGPDHGGSAGSTALGRLPDRDYDGDNNQL